MRCGYCFTDAPTAETIGDHELGKCLTPAAGWRFHAAVGYKSFETMVAGNDAWQDAVEEIAEALFPTQYWEVLAKDGDLSESDENIIMRTEGAAERALVLDMLSRICWAYEIEPGEIQGRLEEIEVEASARAQVTGQ
jgi:hypothetical protein